MDTGLLSFLVLLALVGMVVFSMWRQRQRHKGLKVSVDPVSGRTLYQWTDPNGQKRKSFRNPTRPGGAWYSSDSRYDGHGSAGGGGGLDGGDGGGGD